MRFGDHPSHGGWACRCRRKRDRAERYHWKKTAERWAAKLMTELLRQSPHQTGWSEP